MYISLFFLASTLITERFSIETLSSGKAIDHYVTWAKEEKKHNPELLQALALKILKEGAATRDPDIQLATLFGAQTSDHEEALKLIEDALTSPFMPIQLIAVKLLSEQRTTQAEQALLGAMATPYPIVRLEALFALAQNKSKNASTLAEAAMARFPEELKPAFCTIFAHIGDKTALSSLRRLMNDQNLDVRCTAIQEAEKQGLDEMLPKVRNILLHANPKEQKAAASFLGALKDKESIEALKKRASSPHKEVKLTASLALYRLGEKSFALPLIQSAQEKNLQAISALATVQEGEHTLLSLLHSTIDTTVQFNAALSLLERGNLEGVPFLTSLLLTSEETFLILPSLDGLHIVAYMVDNPSAQEVSRQLKESIAHKILLTPKRLFFAEEVLKKGVKTFIPQVFQTLKEQNRDEAYALCKKYRNVTGSPYTRTFSILTLHQMEPTKETQALLLSALATTENLIDIRPPLPFELERRTSPFELTPKEQFCLTITLLETLATSGDDVVIDKILEMMQHRCTNNRYALAGLLLKLGQ